MKKPTRIIKLLSNCRLRRDPPSNTAIQPIQPNSSNFTCNHRFAPQSLAHTQLAPISFWIAHLHATKKTSERERETSVKHLIYALLHANCKAKKLEDYYKCSIARASLRVSHIKQNWVTKLWCLCTCTLYAGQYKDLITYNDASGTNLITYKDNFAPAAGIFKWSMYSVALNY